MYRQREMTIDGMLFQTEQNRAGLFYFYVHNPETCQWVHGGEPIHGRPSEKKAQASMVHYGKLALEAANG